MNNIRFQVIICKWCSRGPGDAKNRCFRAILALERCPLALRTLLHAVPCISLDTIFLIKLSLPLVAVLSAHELYTVSTSCSAMAAEPDVTEAAHCSWHAYGGRRCVRAEVNDLNACATKLVWDGGPSSAICWRDVDGGLYGSSSTVTLACYASGISHHWVWHGPWRIGIWPALTPAEVAVCMLASLLRVGSGQWKLAHFACGQRSMILMPV